MAVPAGRCQLCHMHAQGVGHVHDRCPPAAAHAGTAPACTLVGPRAAEICCKCCTLASSLIIQILIDGRDGLCDALTSPCSRCGTCLALPAGWHSHHPHNTSLAGSTAIPIALESEFKAQAVHTVVLFPGPVSRGMQAAAALQRQLLGTVRQHFNPSMFGSVHMQIVSSPYLVRLADGSGARAGQGRGRVGQAVHAVVQAGRQASMHAFKRECMPCLARCTQHPLYCSAGQREWRRLPQPPAQHNLDRPGVCCLL